MDHEVAETGADVDGSLARAVHQFERDDFLAGELEHGEAVAVTEVDATDLAITECGVEMQRGIEIGDPVRAMEGPHAMMVLCGSDDSGEVTTRSYGLSFNAAAIAYLKLPNRFRMVLSWASGQLLRGLGHMDLRLPSGLLLPDQETLVPQAARSVP